MGTALLASLHLMAIRGPPLTPEYPLDSKVHIPDVANGPGKLARTMFENARTHTHTYAAGAVDANALL